MWAAKLLAIVQRFSGHDYAVNSGNAVQIGDSVYKHLYWDGKVDSTLPAFALHEAAGNLRDNLGEKDCFS